MLWAIELLEFKLVYKQKTTIKAQVLIDFIIEMTRPEVKRPIQQEWTLCVDGLSNNKGSKTRVILEGPEDMVLKYSLKFNF